MGRKKLNIFQRIQLINKYINKKEMKEIRGINCEYCKNQDFKVIEKGVSTNYETLTKFNIRYKCKNCGAIIDEVQTHRKTKDWLNSVFLFTLEIIHIINYNQLEFIFNQEVDKWKDIMYFLQILEKL